MPKSEAPGFVKQTRAGGVAMYWIASRAARGAAGYAVKTIRLDGTEDEAKARCLVLTQELREWIAGRVETAPVYRGTVASLIDLYTSDEDSPYRGIRAKTRSRYDDDLAILRRTVGERHVDDLTRKDFAAWHRNYGLPKVKDGQPRIRRAHGLMTMLRILLGFGVSMRLAGCRDARDVLAEMTFAMPARRDKAMTFAQAEAIIDKAIATGARSIGLGQACQFELALRQGDVVGQWLVSEGGGGIAFRGRKWGGGLTWADLTAERLAKRTSKTGQEGQWSPAAYPLLVKAMAAFGEQERVGPAVVDERTGQPYKAKEYGKVWRTIATAAGIPADVWNMDSRAGALTEASEAGAQPDDIRQFATHANFATTERYLRRTGKATDRVADLRTKHRQKNEG